MFEYWIDQCRNFNGSWVCLLVTSIILTNLPASLNAGLYGIDVSHNQSSINWSSVSSCAGKSFAWVKATEGINFQDSNFQSNITGAAANGIKAGAYHFARPVSGTANRTASNEASTFLYFHNSGENPAINYIVSGYLIPALDIEDYNTEHPLQTLGAAALAQWIQDWCSYVKNATGVTPAVYMTVSYAQALAGYSALAQYPLWIATDSGNPSYNPTNLGPWGNKWAFQQYGGFNNAGTVCGISVRTDLDYFPGDAAALNAYVIGGANQPDLTVVGAVTFSPNSVTSGSIVHVEWTEKNLGPGDAVGHNVKVSLAATEYGQTYQVAHGSVLALTAGQMQGYYVDVPVPNTIPSGNYYVTAFVDSDQQVSESDENNNIGSSTPNKITVTGNSTPGASINTKPDFDNDSTSDILWQKSDTGERYVWLMNGTQYSSGISLGTVLPIAWDMVSTGDFDGDGKVDILWRNQSSGECYIWLMNGTQFKSGVNLGTVLPTSWQMVGTGDFDGDGRVDILWQNASSGERYIWLMNGTQFKSGVNLGTVLPTSWQMVGTADFDGDGKVDILWQNVSSGERYIWLMNRTQFKAGVNLGTVLPTSWDIAGTGDFDRDGKADIIWQNRSSGERYLWLMNGTQFKSGVNLGTVLPTTWNIRNH